MLEKVIAPVVLVVACAGCSREAQLSQPLSPQPAAVERFTGIWETEYRVTNCESGRPWHCPTKGSLLPLTLRLEENAGTASGYILDQRGQPSVSGQIAGDTASLQGRTAVENNAYTLIVHRLLLSQPSESQLAGSLELRSWHSPVGMVIYGDIARTIRHTPLPGTGDYAGTWQGGYIVRSCVSDTRNPCGGRESVGRWEFLDLIVEGATYSLRLETRPRYSLLGTSGSSGLNLHSKEIAYHTERMTFIRFNAVRNRVGQLRGNFTYILKQPLPDGRIETRTADFELLDVVQVR